MSIDTDSIDDAVLALLYLGRHDQWWMWKSFDWDATDRLHRKGLISRPGWQGQVGRLQRAGMPAPSPLNLARPGPHRSCRYAVAGNIGGENRGELSFDRLSRDARLLPIRV